MDVFTGNAVVVIYGVSSNSRLLWHGARSTQICELLRWIQKEWPLLVDVKHCRLRIGHRFYEIDDECYDTMNLLKNSNYSQFEPLGKLIPESGFCSAHIYCPLLGGKGGFGSQLRAAGGKMSQRRKRRSDQETLDDSLDSCRDLQGRRIGTVRKAKAQSDLAQKLKMEQKSWRDKKIRDLERILNGESSNYQLKDSEASSSTSIDGEDHEHSIEKIRTITIKSFSNIHGKISSEIRSNEKTLEEIEAANLCEGF